MTHTNTHGLPQITVKELRDQLAALGPAWDNAEVKCWLPGQRIALSSLIPHNGTKLGATPVLLIEGNVEPGGALDRLIENTVIAEKKAAGFLS